MSVVIVGGDHLGCIPKELDRIGISKIQHLNGRSGQKIRGKMPDKADFIILLYDFVNHNLAYKIKKLPLIKEYLLSMQRGPGHLYILVFMTIVRN